MDYRRYFFLFVTVVLSACSISYELILANALATLNGNYIFWNSFAIAFFIGGLGLGASLEETSDELNSAQLIQRFIKFEYALCFLGAISIFYIQFITSFYHVNDFNAYYKFDFYSPEYINLSIVLKTGYLLFAACIILAIGFLSGKELPFLMSLISKKSPREEEKVDLIVLAFNYFGTLLGTLLYSFYFFRNYELVDIGIYIACFNFLIIIFLHIISKNYKIKHLIAMPVMAASLMALISHSPGFMENILKIRYLFPNIGTDYEYTYKFFSDLPKFNKVERIRTKYQVIDMYDTGEEFIMTLDSNFQFSDQTEHFYHEAFAHIPIEMTKLEVSNVLVLGAGDGLLLRELVKYPRIKSITQIELDEEVYQISKTNKKIKSLNKGAFEDPRVNTIIADAFTYLRQNTMKYDAIFIDFPYPKNFNVAKLYSEEFYKFVFKAMSPSGFVVLDCPFMQKQNYLTKQNRGRAILSSIFTEKDKIQNSIFASSIVYAGFKHIFPFKVYGESFIVASKRHFAYDYEKIDTQYFSKIGEEELREISRQEFPHYINRKYINSVFRPKLSHEIFKF